MPLRSPKMYSFILGFQRLVWCPKWTPASSNSLIVTDIMHYLPSGLIRRAPHLPPESRVPAGPPRGIRARVNSVRQRAGPALLISHGLDVLSCLSGLMYVSV